MSMKDGVNNCDPTGRSKPNICMLTLSKSVNNHAHNLEIFSREYTEENTQ